jgi:hypothetical protein
VSSPPKSQPFLGFPEPNVHLIKARLNPLPRIPNNNLPSLSISMRYNAFVYWELCTEVEDEEENYFFEEGLF